MEKSSDGPCLADARQPGVFLGSVPDGVVCLAAERGRILCPARRFRRGAIPPGVSAPCRSEKERALHAGDADVWHHRRRRTRVRGEGWHAGDADR